MKLNPLTQKIICLFLGAFGFLSSQAQDPNLWDTYTQNQLEYPVLSAVEGRMLTPFVGLQVDARLLRNRRYGFFLGKAGFRKDEKTGEVRCFEAVFSNGTTNYLQNEETGNNRYKITVELIGFDTRSPKQRAATYKAVFYNISFDQEKGSFRCQIPVKGPINEHMAFVLLVKPPYLTAELSAYRELKDARFFEGPWVEDPGKPVFVYPKDKAPREIQPDKSHPIFEIQALQNGQVYNDYGYPVPAKHFEWSKKGSNYSDSYSENGKSGMKAKDGTILIPAQYEELHFAFSGFMIAKKNGKVGVVNEANNVVIPFEYKSLELLYRNQVSQVPSGVSLDDLRLLARKSDGQTGVINGRAEEVVPFRACRSVEAIYFYDAPRHESLGIILSYPGDYQRLMDETAIVFNCEEGYGAVTANGALLLPFEYQSIEAVADSRNSTWVVAISKADRYGLFDLHGKWIFEPKFEYGFGLFGNLNQAKNQNLSNLIIARFTPAQEGENYPISGVGIVDTMGESLIPFEYNGFGATFEVAGKRHFTARKNGRWGVIDMDNQVKVPFKYTPFIIKYEFDGKVYFALKDSTDKFYGLLSLEDKMVIPFKYTYLGDGNGQSWIVLNEKFQNGLVNLRGQEVLPLEYDNISSLPNGHFYLQKDGLGGIADPMGKVVVPIIYRGLYGKDYLPGYQSYFDKKGIKLESVVAVLTNEKAAFAYLKDGQLLELD